MRYVAKSECESLEAARFTLDGASYVAVACDGRVHTLPAEAFDLLYEPKLEPARVLPLPPIPEDKRTTVRISEKPVRKPKSEEETVSARIVRILEQYGPQTHAELAERVYPELMPTLRGQRLWGLLYPLKAKRIVEKREQPGSGLDKWTLIAQPEVA